MSYNPNATAATPQIFQAIDNITGLPLAGGQLFTYASGTITPQAAYTDNTLTIPLPNPIILDNYGQAVIWLGPNPYRFNLLNAAGVQQAHYPQDNIQPQNFTSFTTQLAASATPAQGQGLVGFNPALTYAAGTLPAALASTTSGQGAALVGDTTGRNQHQKNSDVVNIMDVFPGVVGDGVTNDAVAFQSGINALQSAGKVVVVNLSTRAYKLNAPIAFVPYLITFKGDRALLDFSGIQATTAGGFITGVQYTIVSAGTTNFTLIGAANSTPGTLFIATGPGTGTGTAMGVALTGLAGSVATQDLYATALIGIAIKGPGIASSCDGLALGGPGTSLNQMNFNELTISDFRTGVLFQNNTWSLRFNECMVFNCTTDVAWPGNILTLGGGFTFTNCSLFNSTIGIVMAAVNCDATFNRCLFDSISAQNSYVTASMVTYIECRWESEGTILTQIPFYISNAGNGASTRIIGGLIELNCSPVSYVFDNEITSGSGNGGTFGGGLVLDSVFIQSKGTSNYLITGNGDAMVNNCVTLDSTTATFVAAGSFVNGAVYAITIKGSTDFTLVGAANNNIGTIFTATGAGAGTGYAINTTDIRPALTSSLNNLAIDGGFESANGILDDVSIAQDTASITSRVVGTNINITQSSAQAHSGSKSLAFAKINATVSVADGQIAIPLQSRQGRLGLSLWYDIVSGIPASSTGSGTIYVTLNWAAGMRVNASGVPSWTQRITVPLGTLTLNNAAYPSGGWTNWLVKVGRAPAWATHALIYVSLDNWIGPDTIYFDDLVLTTM